MLGKFREMRLYIFWIDIPRYSPQAHYFNNLIWPRCDHSTKLLSTFHIGTKLHEIFHNNYRNTIKWILPIWTFSVPWFGRLGPTSSPWFTVCFRHPPPICRSNHYFPAVRSWIPFGTQNRACRRADVKLIVVSCIPTIKYCLWSPLLFKVHVRLKNSL